MIYFSIDDLFSTNDLFSIDDLFATVNVLYFITDIFNEFFFAEEHHGYDNDVFKLNILLIFILKLSRMSKDISIKNV